MMLVPDRYTLTGHSPSLGDAHYGCFAAAPVDLRGREESTEPAFAVVNVMCSMR
jgi:hypothetical protein